jgi:RNA-directed DNA polymerase
VSYADDFVILSRGHATEALAWTRSVMTKLDLALNEAKTSLKDARSECFDFLGYTFGPHRRWQDGRRYLGASPSKKSVRRLKEKIGDVLTPGNMEPWTKVCGRLNRLLLGWSGYFAYGSRAKAHRAIDHYLVESIQHFLRRRHKLSTRGAARFSYRRVFGDLGIVQLRRDRA